MLVWFDAYTDADLFKAFEEIIVEFHSHDKMHNKWD